MSLKYTCPVCGTPLGYKGLCWKCRSGQERDTVLHWSPEQVKEKQDGLVRNIRRLADMEDPELTDFWQLLGYRDAIMPRIQRAALAAEVYYPCELYYHAPEDVRDGLIHALLSAENSSEASELMCCLAMQGDDRALETLLELEKHPRPWRKNLYVDPSIYAQCGGWTFDKEGQRMQLNFDTCYPMARNLPSALAGHGRTPVPTAADGWWIFWCWMDGMKGWDSWGWTASLLPPAVPTVWDFWMGLHSAALLWTAVWRCFPPGPLMGQGRWTAMSGRKNIRH